MTPLPWPTFRAADGPMDMLIKLSRFYGADDEFVLAGGGNTSVKIGDRLVVKASGYPLAAIGPEGFVELDRKALAELLDRDLGRAPARREERFKQAILAARTQPEKGRRPSVESVLHHLLPGRFVVHSHPTPVNMIACCAAGQTLCGELLGDLALWVPYCDPGFTLAKLIQKSLGDYRARTGRDCPPAVVIQNHGLIVCGQTPDEVKSTTDAIVEKVHAKLSASGGPARPLGSVSERPDAARAQSLVNLIGPALRALLAEGDDLKIVTFDDSDVVMNLAGSKDGTAIAAGGPLTPDQVVYCNSCPLWFVPAADDAPQSTVEALRRAIAEHEKAARFKPKVVLVAGLGLFAGGRGAAQADAARRVYIDAIKVMAGAAKLGGIRFLDQDQRRFIEDWEVESYRKQVASAGGPKAGRAAGKVALVTGAARGFGLEISQDLAAQGAVVVLADINGEGARKAAADICAREGQGRALGLAVDVTEGRSVAAAIDQVVRAYGGLDLLISNAGVLKAGSVKTQPADEFDSVTAVNYKGYFLSVQKAAPVMAVQHLAKADYWSDIIQINSKSGLAGSNRNAAYAGSKFGGIGLTQSFALELVADGIKVNAICPGNFFEGPLWSDPTSGLFVQYLRSGKVPGAKTIEDVKRFYEAKAPMGRGCRAADVMKAIYYLMEQKYETGQAIAVTGGQVMLS